jgi:hypothetical protein
MALTCRPTVACSRRPAAAADAGRQARLAMTVILQATNGEDLQVNQWNWRPTTVLIGRALGLDAERIEKLCVNEIGESLSSEETARLAEFLDNYLADFPADGRLLQDGPITRDPKSYELDLCGKANYSASYGWLTQLREFCRASGGFEII